MRSGHAEASIPVVKSRLQRFWKSWATRSLIIGAVGAGIDIIITNLLVLHLDFSWRWGAMTGLIVGASVNFLLNRYIAFREHAAFVSPLVRFAVMTAVQSLIHGQVVVMIGALMRDVVWPLHRWGIEATALESMKLTFAKMVADVLVFTVLQLVILRYVIFPRKKAEPEATASTQPLP